jgi:hypothetical protein
MLIPWFHNPGMYEGWEDLGDPNFGSYQNGHWPPEASYYLKLELPIQESIKYFSQSQRPPHYGTPQSAATIRLKYSSAVGQTGSGVHA